MAEKKILRKIYDKESDVLYDIGGAVDASIDGDALVIDTDTSDNTFSNDDTVAFAPIYKGDYLTKDLPSSCLLIDGYFYTFNATTNTDNKGTLRAFNVSNNSEDTGKAKSIKLGHANSAAYDPDNGKIYIAPIWDYSSGNPVNINELYVYGTSFTTVDSVTLPTRALGVSYDDHTGTLYYIDYNYDVYKIKSENEIVKYSTVDVDNSDLQFATNDTDYSFNQDFAVNNGRFYLSSPVGIIATGVLEKGKTSKIDGFYHMLHNDTWNRYFIGELEGMEFVDDHLIASVYSDLNLGYKNGMVVELPITSVAPTQGAFGWGLTNNTFSINNTTINKFRLASNELRSLNQLTNCIFKPSAINVGESGGSFTDPCDEPIITSSALIRIKGKYSVKNITVFNGEVNFHFDASDSVLELRATSGVCIGNDRNGMIHFSSPNNQINISTPNYSASSVSLLGIGYVGPVTVIHKPLASLENKSALNIGSTNVIGETGIFVGSVKK